MTSEMITAPTGTSLQRLGELASERLGGESRLFFEDQSFTGLELAARTRRLSQGFREVEIVEPTRVPTNPAGRAAHDERFACGEHGKLVTPELEIFGRRVDQTFLSNTHSFHCFARGPIG